jgi:hypothetical protein
MKVFAHGDRDPHLFIYLLCHVARCWSCLHIPTISVAAAALAQQDQPGSTTGSSTAAAAQGFSNVQQLGRADEKEEKRIRDMKV